MSVAVPGQQAAASLPIAAIASCARPERRGALDDDLRGVRTRARAASIAVVSGLFVVAAGVGVVGEPRLSLLACVCVLGWLNLAAGPCAQNAMTAITPLAMGRSKKTWYQATVAYTLAGLVSSVTIGVLLGAVGAA